MAQFVVGTEIFTTKKALTERCRKILHRYEPEESIDAPDRDFLELLIAGYHPDAIDKIGCGIRRMFVRRSEYGNFGFWLERTDGTQTDFSFVACISNPTPWQDFCRACRRAIADQILDFKSRSGPPFVCEETGAILDDADVHVDHKSPFTFDEILRGFLGWAFIDYRTIPVKPTTDGIQGCFLANESVESSWRTFHRRVAELRIVSRKVNLSNCKKS